MESNKSKMLRIVNTIYDIVPHKLVTIIRENNQEQVFVCKTVNGELDLYNPKTNTMRWGISCEGLDDMRECLLKDFLEGLFVDIKL
jgi:hypothetical protein